MNTSEEKTGPKRLFRSSKDYAIAGIAGGLGEYFNIDPVIIRVVFVFFAVFTGGVFILGYLILIFVIPKELS